MKILALVDDHTYICQVSLYEIQRYMNYYYHHSQAICVNDEIDLSRGHDYAADIATAASATKKFIEENKKATEAILCGFHIAGRMAEEVERF